MSDSGSSKINSWEQHINCTDIDLDCLIFLQTRAVTMSVFHDTIIVAKQIHDNEFSASSLEN